MQKIFKAFVSNVLKSSLSILLGIAPATAYSMPLSEAIDLAKKKHLASELQWLNLLHYKKGLLSGLRSQVASEGFFLSPDGRGDAEKELVATLEWFYSGKIHEYAALYGNKTEKQAARCQFPARYIWLIDQLNFDDDSIPKVDCAAFDKFEKTLSAKSVSLVFSSYYLNNPSSAFGHSFLRMNKAEAGGKDSQKYELLDHGVNFAAEITTSNALFYAVYGLIGAFRGTYSNVPYYYKVREYNDYESRDLWSYDLNLTSAEMKLLTAHIWELGPIYFNYYYFTQNCSYQILTAIEAAAPRFKITDFLPSLYVIPADTVKQVVKTPGLVGKISYRPSVRSQFYYRLSQLTPDEQTGLKKVVVDGGSPEILGGMKPESKAKVLDAALDYTDFKHPEEAVTKKDTENTEKKQKLLFARAEVPLPTPPLEMSTDRQDSPHLGHGSTRLGIDPGYENGPGYFSQLNMRFALHDLLDPSLGYPKNSEIEFLHIDARYYWNPSGFEFEDAALFRIISLSPLSTYDKALSWRVELGGKRFRDNDCGRCFGADFEIGGGYTIAPFQQNFLKLFAMGEFTPNYAPDFYGSKLRLGVGPSAGLLLDADVFKALFRAAYHYDIFSVAPDTYEFSSDLRANFSDAFAASLRGTIYTNTQEAVASAFFYF